MDNNPDVFVFEPERYLKNPDLPLDTSGFGRRFVYFASSNFPLLILLQRTVVALSNFLGKFSNSAVVHDLF